MSVSVTSLCNLSLARIGAKRINNYETDQTLEAIQCQIHYEHVRDALLQSHLWRFARARAELSEDTVTPDFEWDHQYILPTDCFRVIGLYDTTNSYDLEGERLLTDDDEVDLWYIRKVTDPTEFSPLFRKVLALQLALQLVLPLAKGGELRQDIERELFETMARARTINLQETNTVGRADLDTWVDARKAGAV